MAPTDLNVLLDMGFDPVRAELAVKKTGGSMYLYMCMAFIYCGS